MEINRICVNCLWTTRNLLLVQPKARPHLHSHSFVQFQLLNIHIKYYNHDQLYYSNGRKRMSSHPLYVQHDCHDRERKFLGLNCNHHYLVFVLYMKLIMQSTNVHTGSAVGFIHDWIFIGWYFSAECSFH